MTELRRHLLEEIRQGGEPLSPELAAAFAGVPREAFVPDGFQRRDGSWAQPADPDFLSTVYRDDVLVTKVEGRVPVSSSSQPSLMAAMITALRVRPGQRILEVGTGTGYNAALLATLGATVTSVDVRADVAARARTALARAGVPGVRVEHGDGYLGMPGQLFDRIIVTVGVAGISPHWLEQLAPDGFVIAPVVHAGTHPVLAVRGRPPGPVTAAVVCPSGFMSAAGPLTAAYEGAHPPPAAARGVTDLARFAGPRFDPPLSLPGYRDLWYAAGAWSRRVTHGTIPGHEQSYLVLVDEDGAGGAVILSDGSVLAAGESAARDAAEAAGLIDRWVAAGWPPLRAWRIGLGPAGDPDSPIWVPRGWELSR